jgi:hypothetical protein
VDGDSDKAKEYRERAEQIRLMAKRMLDAESKNLLLLVAENYERLAATMENIARSDITRSDRNSKPVP